MADQITLPEVVVTPDEKPSAALTAGLGGAAPGVAAHTAQTIARVAGHGWDAIDGHATDVTDRALASGNTQRDVDEHFGWPDAAPFQDRSRQQWETRLSQDPDLAHAFDQPDPALTLSGDWMRDDYARAMIDGHVKSPADFAQQYVSAYTKAAEPASPERTDEVARAIAEQLPSHHDAIDYSIALGAQAGQPFTPQMLGTTKANLLDHYAETGMDPAKAHAAAAADPALREKLTTPPQVPFWAADPEAAAAARVSEVMEPAVADWAYKAITEGSLADVKAAGDRAVAAFKRRDIRGLVDATLDNPLAFAIGPGTIGKVSIKLFDPLKAPAEAVREVPAAEAHNADQALHETARSVAGEPEAVKTSILQKKIDELHAAEERSAAGEAPAGTSTFFQDLQAKHGENSVIPLVDNPEQAVELSKGYDAARALISHLFQDESGAVPNYLHRFFGTAVEKAEAAFSHQSDQFAQAQVRRFRGLAEREQARDFDTLERYRKDINQHMPEYLRWLRMGPTKPAQQPLIANLIDYIEGRSLGAALDHKSPFAPVADALRTAYEKLRTEIETYDPNFTAFFEDYYRHLWTKPRGADQAFGVGKQGSGASLNLRSIPTISDGLARGLMPKIADPIENTLHYMAAMRQHLAAKRVLDESRAAGYVKYGTSAPFPGWVRLEGMASEMPAGPNAIQRAYAPPGFARAYNNNIGQGFYRWKIGGDIYNGLQRVANAMTMAKLAVSGYHLANIAKETGTAQLTNGLGEISHGELIEGLRNMGFGASILPGVVDYAVKGHQFQKEYLGKISSGNPIVDLATEAGFRPLGRSQTYSGVASPDVTLTGRGPTIMQMIRRRSLGWQYAEDIRRIGGDAHTEPNSYRAMMAGPRAVGFIANQVAHAMDAFNAPLFDHLIPKVKAGAFADEMETWLRQNPTAGREEQLSVARKLSDSMDDRFGEMNQDNLFWPRMVKQVLNLATISVGWEYGTLRAFGGAAKDIGLGNLNSTRARWLMAYPMMMMMTSAMYQYAHTGQGPQSAGDLILPRTGGVDFHDMRTPERALAPGYEKDPMQWYKALASAPDFMHGVSNVASLPLSKLNPFWGAIRDTVSTHDAIGHNIYNGPTPLFQSWGLPPDIGNWLGYMADAITPIPFQNKALKGTHITNAERWMGYRPAPLFYMNHDLAMQKIQQGQRREQQIERRRFGKEQSQLEP